MDVSSSEKALIEKYRRENSDEARLKDLIERAFDSAEDLSILLYQINLSLDDNTKIKRSLNTIQDLVCDIQGKMNKAFEKIIDGE